jgi:predicted flap endonuclease-1-like 5' DNA nuclease/outer membrane murein-binding lipoprotein Lpp
MIALLDFCSIPWYLTWLLPFLLGLALGWLLWAKFRQIAEELQTNINELNAKISGLEADLNICRKSRMEAEGNVAMLRGRIRELESKGALSGGTTSSGISAGAVPLTSNIAPGDKYYAVIGGDNLQIIEGIGPKMEEVLKENGVSDFEALEYKTSSELRDILNKYGDKYKIIDPATWPQQAAIAKNRNWDGLIQLQKSLDTGRGDLTAEVTDSKLEKYLIKAGVLKKWAQDDLKAVEGIGPKIEELLHNAGINTWRALSETPVERIQEILKAAGPRYQLADPGSWPQQALLAVEAKWDELKVLQDMLQRGK